MVDELMKFCKEKNYSIEFSGQEQQQLEYQLQTEIESVIQRFDKDQETEIYVQNNQFSLEISKQEFFKICKPFFQQIEDLIESIKEIVQQLEEEKIDEVLIAGYLSQHEEIK